MPKTKLEEAIQFALDAHEGHLRKGDHPLPYFVHLIDVLHKVRLIGGVMDEDALCAAVLHDTLEDTDVTPEQLEERFGPKVRLLVVQLTRRTSKQSEDHYSAMLLEDIAHMHPDAQRIKLADRLANLWESSRTRPQERTRKYAEEALKMLEIIPKDTAPTLWAAVDAFSRECIAQAQKSHGK
ncbi:MAG: HD domain-containing protein [Fimbriimonas sp.]